MIPIMLFVIYAALSGLICAFMATVENRRPWAWGAAGVVIPLLPLIVMACWPTRRSK